MDVIIDELVELNKAAKAKAPTIAQIVSGIKAAGEDSVKSFNAFFLRVDGNCKTGDNLLNSFLNNLKGDQVAANAGLAEANTDLNRNNVNAEKYNKQVAATKKTIHEGHAAWEAGTKIYRESHVEAHKKTCRFKIY
jgi:hypothetical protein